ncbi:MAG: DUF5721 family protein [Eubacteriales bacterium]|nr:DUF5721 family protein [Eubacteriales bacterium]
MLALNIIDVKEFMNQMLIGTTFDQFEMVETVITTFNTFSIDGKLRRDFFDTDTCDIFDQSGMTYSLWKEIKPFCYSVIRGKRTPLHFRIVFQISHRQKQAILKNLSSHISPEMVSGMFINIQYKNKELLCTTGISLKTFIPDKSPEQQWDAMVLDFFRRHNILFDQM